MMPFSAMRLRSAASGITLIQNSGTQHSGASITSFPYVWPTAPKIGHKLIITVVCWRSAGAPTLTITDNVGNTYTSRSSITNGGSTRTQIFESDITSVPTTTTINISGTAATVGLGATFSEWANLAAFDVQATSAPSVANGTNTATVGPTATLAQADELVISAIGGATSNTASAITVPTGATVLGIENNSSSFIGMGAGYQIVKSTAAVTHVWTLTMGATSTMAMAMATFKKA